LWESEVKTFNLSKASVLNRKRRWTVKMIKSIYSDKKPLVGFFNLFYNFGETCRSVQIAKRYKELGGKVIFFSHGGEHENLAKEIGCEVVRVKPIYNEKIIDLFWKSSRLETFKNPFPRKFLIEHVDEEIKAFKETGVKLIVSTNNFPCIISARAAGIPLIFVTPKTPKRFTRYPDDAEFFFTKLVPHFLKLKVLNFCTPKLKMYIKSFNKVAKKYNVSIPNKGMDSLKGDYTFYVDFIEFMDIEKTTIPSDEFYIGHSLLDELYNETLNISETEKEERQIEQHLKRDGKTILLTLGSSGTKELYLRILKALNKTNYTVIAVYTQILDEKDLPKLNDNILLKKYVPSMAKLNKIVDLAIINGGKSTVYTAAYAGKPAIGFPMQFEQHLNLEMLVRHGMGIIASRKYFKEETLLKTIDKIFDNYDIYLKNAQSLAGKLPKPEGDKNAAEILVEILRQNHLT